MQPRAPRAQTAVQGPDAPRRVVLAHHHAPAGVAARLRGPAALLVHHLAGVAGQQVAEDLQRGRTGGGRLGLHVR